MKTMMQQYVRPALLALGMLAPAAALAQVDLQTTLSGPTMAAGSPVVSYTVTVTNKGSAKATNVSVKLERPAALPRVVLPKAANGCVEAATSLTCTLAGLAPGASLNAVFVLNGEVKAPISFPLTASAQAAQTDSNGANNTVAQMLAATPHCTAGTGGALVCNKYFTLTAKHSGKVLNVPGARVDDGAELIQWAQAGGSHEQWLIEEVPAAK